MRFLVSQLGVVDKHLLFCYTPLHCSLQSLLGIGLVQHDWQTCLIRCDQISPNKGDTPMSGKSKGCRTNSRARLKWLVLIFADQPLTEDRRQMLNDHIEHCPLCKTTLRADRIYGGLIPGLHDIHPPKGMKLPGRLLKALRMQPEG